MDPEVIAQIEEQLRQMNELLAQQNSMMASQLGAMKGAAGKLNSAYGSFSGNMNNATQSTNKYLEAQQKAVDQANASVEKWGNAVKTTEKAIAGFNGALSGVSGIIGSFGGALLSAEKGFSKYGSTVDSAANAAQGLASAIPVVGQALSGVVGVLGKAISRVVGDALKLTDTIVNLRDETVKTTGVLPTTTEGMLQLANNAKYFGENIQVLGKITQGLGNNLVGLGDTAGRGAAKFMELADVTEETRQRFGKMGINQEELTKLQGEYVKSQVQSGLAYNMQNKTMEQLRRESLKYAENMVTLSGLTGKQAETLQAEQDAARAVMQEKVAQRQDLIELQNLRKQGRMEEAAALESRMKEKAEFRDRLVALVGPEQAAQVMRVVRTGVYDNISGPLASLGINFQQVSEQLNNGAKGIDAANSLADTLSSAYDNRLTSLGNAAPFLDEDTFKQIGINADTMGRQNVYFGKTIEEREKMLKEDQAKRQQGSPMDDAIEKARSFERQIQQQYQNFLIEGIKKAAALLKATDLNKLAADAMKYGMIALKVGLTGLGVVTGILIAAKYKEWRASLDAKEAQRQFTKALQESTVAMRNQANASRKAASEDSAEAKASRAATTADKSEAGASKAAANADKIEAAASKSAASADKAEASASRKAAQADLREASASMRAASADLKEASASMKAASADLAEARASMKAAQADAMEGMGGDLGGGKGGKGFLGKLGKGLKGGLAGILGGLVLDTASEYAMESGHEKVGAGLDVGSSALSGAGTGALIGSVIPGVGTVVGGAVGGVLGGLYGLWQNKDTLLGDGKTAAPNEQPAADLSPEEKLAAANEAAYQKQLDILSSISVPGNGQDTIESLSPEQKEAIGIVPEAKEPQTEEEKQKAAQAQQYQIKQGDTLSQLAEQFGTTVEALMAANPDIKNKDLIRAGANLNIPGLAGIENGQYTVKKGDTLQKLAEQYGTTYEDLMKANPNLKKKDWKEGYKLNIPESMENGQYTVKKGDTLQQLAQQYGTTYEALMKANPNLKKGDWREGYQLSIPGMGNQLDGTTSTVDPNEMLEDVQNTTKRANDQAMEMLDDQRSSVDSLITSNSNFSNSVNSTANAMRIFRELISSVNMLLGGVDENGSPTGAMNPMGGSGMQFDGNTDKILSTIRQMESGNNYAAQNPTSSASGAYQFIDGTWQALTKKYGIGTEFKSAKDAPPAIQDQIAQKYLSEILEKSGGDVSKVPVAWFTGNVQGKSSAVSQSQVAAYQNKWMGIYGQQGPSQAGTQGGNNLLANLGKFNQGLAQANNTMAGLPSASAAGGVGPLGNALQNMGLRVSENPMFGGVKGKHSRTGGHYDGTAIDVNAGVGVNEATDPKWGPIFDQLAMAGKMAGYHTLWRVPDHYDHIHFQYSQSMGSNSKIGLPQAERGGVLKGPDDGYLAMLHGKEMVVPLDNKYTRSQKAESYTVNGKPASKREYDSFMKSHPELQNLQDKVKSMLTSMQDKSTDPTRLLQAASTLMDTNLAGIKDEIIDKNQRIQESITQMVATETSKAVKAVNDANLPMQSMSNELSRSMRKVMEAHTQSMNEMTYKLGEMIDALNTSNDTTKKILKKASA